MTLSTTKVVGLTGGLGSGKSTVRRVWEQFGVPAIDIDLVAREIHQDPGHPAVNEIARAFPNAMHEDGRLFRGSLRSFFACDVNANIRLKAILRPHVMAQLQSWTAQQRSPYVVWESAILVEERIRVDRMVVVDVQAAEQITRVQRRNRDWSLVQINAVLSMQLSRQERLAHADDTISNAGTLSELAEYAKALHHAYLQSWS